MTKNSIVLGKDVTIHPTAQLIGEEIEIGDFSKIGPNVVISGKSVKIGREAWIGERAIIGGGRAEFGTLIVGDFLHLGIRGQINIANNVVIGDEVGMGMNSMVFSHGAYLSEYEGYPYQDAPVTIGSNVWLPYAIVNPGIEIGHDVVVAAMSLVSRSLPSGCLAGGIPAKVLKENAFPRKVSVEEKIRVLDQIIIEASKYNIKTERDENATSLTVKKTIFEIPTRTIEGSVDEDTEKVKNLLRRHGIRFRYFNDGKIYREWD